MLDNERTTMTQKDYRAFAAALASVRPTYDYRESSGVLLAAQRQWEACCRVVGDVCATDNPRFDRIRFVKACLAES
jgi:hypothetical protein